MNHRPGHSGFTLLELLVVLLIMAIAIGIAMPVLSGSARGRRLADTTNEILALTRYGREQAISQGHTFRLNFNLENNTYWLTEQRYGSEPQALQNEFGRKFEAPEGIWLETNIDEQVDGVYVAFQPNGRTQPGTIRVKGVDNRELDIICESATETYHLAD